MASISKDLAVQNLSDNLGTKANPTVSFVVLCYKLAHLLPECVNSILSQSYCNIELVIMDDCSPDNTEEVARAFQDPRVRYVRNEKNLGVLRNENEGVRLSRGKYVWIISADDYLRKPYIVQRYVELMENHPRVGYVICSGVGVRDGRETGVLPHSKYRDQDAIVPGHVFLKKLLHLNVVLAPSAMARRECYEKITLYPLHATFGEKKVDMVWASDWYVWCAFALSFDVAYFAEPMVCYREHDLSITSMITKRETIDQCAAADIAVPWMIRRKADEAGLTDISLECMRAAAHEYALHGGAKLYRGAESCMNFEDFEDSLCRSTEDESERNWIRARFYAAKGNASFTKEDLAGAKRWYLLSLRKDPLQLTVYARLLLSLGKHGIYARRALRRIRMFLNS
jgi:glycosyltransferase involved in cell wall biosynthesis